MKNLILTLCLLMVVSLTYAQLHVVKEVKDADNNVITPNGAVGIGTPTPTKKLDVNGDLNVMGIRNENNNNKYAASISVGKNGGSFGKASVDLFANANLTTEFYANLEGLPGNKKYVSTFSHHGDGHFQLRTWDPSSEIRFVTHSGPGEGPQQKMVIKSGKGFVGIGTASPTAKLEVNGAAKKNGGGEWATTSDKRTKKNINQYEAGLEDVLKLNPVTFNYNGKAGITDMEQTHVGLIAQEFAEIAPYAVDKFNFTEEGSNKTEEYMSLDASSVKYMLVNAVKEQQALIEAQKAELETLKETVAKLATNGATIATPGASEMSVLLEGSGTESALLAQNSPNPFTTKTRIEYFIPQNSKHCRLSFRDMNGKELKLVDINHEGIGAIDLSAKDLAAGIYSYVLYVNGDIVASKKMILRQ